MITKAKLQVYNAFAGDIDSWIRLGSELQKSILDDNEWMLIDNFIQDLSLVNKGLVSYRFSENLKSVLDENCEQGETIHELKKLAAPKGL